MAAASMHHAGSDLVVPSRLGQALPALYREPGPGIDDQDEGFVQRFTAALDAVLAPVFCALDNLPAYFDPQLTPEYFLDWLAGWVGLDPYEKWDSVLRRRLVAEAVGLHQARGTKRGIERVVEIFAGVDHGKVTIEESEESDWLLTVRVTADRRDADVERLKRVVEDVVTKVVPAHIFARVVVESA